MDPYIEHPAIWTDFHTGLANEIRAELNPVLQPKYYAGLSSRVVYEVVDADVAAASTAYAARPDVDVWIRETAPGTVEASYAGQTTAPVSAAVPVEVPLELFRVEVHAADGHRLVTVIEILSPVNKRPGHRAHDDYLRKRRHLLRSSAHLLEIDLLRGGERPPLARPVPRAPYYVMLSRAERRPNVDVWPIQLAEGLPAVPVPLLAPDPDASLDLGAAVRLVYERGAYATRIDYTRPPPPPLDPGDAPWIDARLRAAGVR